MEQCHSPQRRLPSLPKKKKLLSLHQIFEWKLFKGLVKKSVHLISLLGVQRALWHRIRVGLADEKLRIVPSNTNPTLVCCRYGSLLRKMACFCAFPFFYKTNCSSSKTERWGNEKRISKRMEWMRDTIWENGKEWSVGGKRKDWDEKNRVRWKRWQKKHVITKAIFLVEQGQHKLGKWAIAWTIKLSQNTI